MDVDKGPHEVRKQEAGLLEEQVPVVVMPNPGHSAFCLQWLLYFRACQSSSKINCCKPAMGIPLGLDRDDVRVLYDQVWPMRYRRDLLAVLPVFCMCVCVRACVCACASVCACAFVFLCVSTCSCHGDGRGQRTACESQFSSSTMWSPNSGCDTW